MKHFSTTAIPIYSIENEAHLLSCIAEGDEKAFKFLYSHYLKELKPLLKKYSTDDIEMREILQETFLKVWLNRDALPDIQNFKAWVYTVASREYLIATRKKINYDKRLQGYSISVAKNVAAQTPADLMNFSEIHHFVLKVISQLPPRRRKIYEMNREGYKINEIAEKLSINPQTVKNVLQIATKTIREELVSIGYGPFLMILIYFFFL